MQEEDVNPVKPKGKRTTSKKVQRLENKPFDLPNAIPAPEDDSSEDMDDDGLNVRRRLFVQYITGKARGNHARAAELAGYASSNRESLSATATRLLSNVSIQKAIRVKLAAADAKPDSVCNSIAQIAQSDMSAFLKVGDDGQPAFDWKSAASAGAIGQVREYSEDGFQTDEGVTIIKRKFKLYDRLKALELLARINGQMIDRVKHEGEVRFNPITLDGDKDIGDPGPEAAKTVSEAEGRDPLPGPLHDHRSDDESRKNGGLPHMDLE